MSQNNKKPIIIKNLLQQNLNNSKHQIQNDIEIAYG